MQVATPSMCILAPLHHVAPPPALAALLADERIFKLGVGVADDGRKLSSTLEEFAGVFERTLDSCRNLCKNLFL